MLADIGSKYGSGAMLTGEVKKILIGVLTVCDFKHIHYKYDIAAWFTSWFTLYLHVTIILPNYFLSHSPGSDVVDVW